MKIIHFLVGRPKAESSNGIVKAVYFLALYEKKLIMNEVWCVTKAFNQLNRAVIDKLELLCFPRRNIFKFLRNVLRTIKYYKDDDIIFHLHGIFNPQNIIFAFLLAINNKKYLITTHGSLNKYALGISKLRKRMVKPFILYLIKKALLVRAISPFEIKELIDYGVSSKKVILIPNGILINQSNIKRTGQRDKKIYVYLGRIDISVKGLDLLAYGVKKANEKGFNGEIWIIGPDYKSNLCKFRELIEDLKLDAMIKILGPKYGNEKNKILSQATFYIQLSRTEGFSLSVLEAMCLNIPLIITPIVDSFNIIEKYKCGFLVDYNSDSVAQILLQSSQLVHVEIESLGNKAKKAAEDIFSLPKIANEMVDIYKRLI